MTQLLSPAAQAIWNAYLDNTEWEVTQCELKAVAAALRALADQVVPGAKYQPIFIGTTAETRWEERQLLRREILAIATELENHQ